MNAFFLSRWDFDQCVDECFFPVAVGFRSSVWMNAFFVPKPPGGGDVPALSGVWRPSESQVSNLS